MLTPDEVCNAFTQQNSRKSWRARVYGDVVHFSATSNMVNLMYDTRTGLFTIQFKKYIAAWGDYIKAIARVMYTTLNTLKSAGLPFEAPQTLEGARIICSTGADNSVMVEWAGLSQPKPGVAPALITLPNIL